MRLWNRRHLDTWKHRGNTSLANVAQTGEGGPWNGDVIYNEPKELANHWSRLPNLTFREYLLTLMNRFDLVSYDAMAMSLIFCLSFWRLETSYDFNVRYCFDCHHLTVELTSDPIFHTHHNNICHWPPSSQWRAGEEQRVTRCVAWLSHWP